MEIYQRKKRCSQQNPNFISRVYSPEKTSPSTTKNNSPSLTSAEAQLQRAKEGFNFANVDITPSKEAFPQPIQRKVEVGQADDKYEQEADQVASQVVKSINTPQNNSLQQKPSNQSGSNNNQQNILNEALQRQSSVRGFVTTRAIQARQEENVGQPFDMTKNKFINSSVVQKRPDLDVKPMEIPPHRIQRRSDFAQGGLVNSQFEQNLTQAKTGGQPLDNQLQRKMGNAIGADFSPIRIHQDNQADHLSRSIQAKAFTTGNHIFFKKGEYNPSSESGQKLIAHELTHTVQQGGAIQRKPAETSKEEQNQVQQTEIQTEQNPPTITPQRIDTTQRASETIQRAVGLEIEVPIPVDNLSPGNVNVLKAQMSSYKFFKEKYALAKQKNREKTKSFNNYTWWWKIFQSEKKRKKLKNEKETAYEEMNQISDQLSGEKYEILDFINQEGKAKYGEALDEPKKGFRIDVDHDDRVKGKSREFPPVEAGGTSLMEIVTYPAETEKDLNETMNNVDSYLKDIMSQTSNLTKRHPVYNYQRIQGIGPFTHPLFPSKGRKPRHNLKGSVQANVGIDLRRYNELIDWYANSQISQVPTTEDDRTQEIYQDIRKHMAQAAQLAREITSQFLRKIVIPEEKSRSGNEGNFDVGDIGNFAGFEGWVTHMALYLRRGMVSGLGGSGKNIVPVLLKTPNYIASKYGMTIPEQLYFSQYKRGITREILKAIGRGDEVEKELSDILAFPEKFKENKDIGHDVALLTDLLGEEPVLTSKPIDTPTGVGPRREGTERESGLPSVDDQFVGGGKNTRGGMVVEFRNIPGLHDGVESWRQIGLDFLSQADKLNQSSKSQPKLDQSSSNEQNMTFDNNQYQGIGSMFVGRGSMSVGRGSMSVGRGSMSVGRGSMSVGRGSMSMNQDEMPLGTPDLSSLRPDDETSISSTHLMSDISDLSTMILSNTHKPSWNIINEDYSISKNLRDDIDGINLDLTDDDNISVLGDDWQNNTNKPRLDIIDEAKEDRKKAQDWFETMRKAGENDNRVLEELWRCCTDPSNFKNMPEGVNNESIFLDEIKKLYRNNFKIFNVLFE